MWDNFFEAGGWGMYPTLVFGFLLLAAVTLHAIRRDPRHARVAGTLALVTVAAGLLGTATGVCRTCRYIYELPQAEQLRTLAAGCEESLHNLVLALILVVLAGIIHALATLRTDPRPPSVA